MRNVATLRKYTTSGFALCTAHTDALRGCHTGSQTRRRAYTIAPLRLPAAEVVSEYRHDIATL